MHGYISDELETWRFNLKEEQRRMLERYVRQKNDEEKTTFKDLANMFVDLRMHKKSDKYKRTEKRIHHDILQLQMETEECSKISVKDLFEVERPGMTPPVRSVVVGFAGIGKSVFTYHILDLWLRHELLHDVIRQVFHFRMRDLSSIQSPCSLQDLIFNYQRCSEPSADAMSEFFSQMQTDPSSFLIIFDGMDEASVMPSENRTFAYNDQVEMPRLIASIVNGCTLPSVRVLVTSRPGGVTNYDTYDKKAVIFGFTRKKMSEYIVKFSGANDEEQEAIEDYINQNVNICSFCYIPVHLNMICRIVKMQMQHEMRLQLPETLTELFVASVTNLLVNHDVKLKDPNADKAVNVIATLRVIVLDHAQLACHGMEQDPIKVSFSNEEMKKFHLEEVAMRCGLLYESEESCVVMFVPSVTRVHFFQHLTLHEFLAAIALVTDVDRVQRMLSKTSNRQLDLVLTFLAGLLGNKRTHQFLRSLHTSGSSSSSSHWSSGRKNDESLEQLMKSVVEREQNHEANTTDKSAVHKAGTMLLLTMIYESRKPELWHEVSSFVLEGGTKLDLEDQHISPTEQHALTYVLPQTRLTSLT